MIEEYEKVVFDELKIGDRSDIIKAHADNNVGEYVSCFYIIERYALDDAYITQNLDQLKNEYYQSIINADIANKAKSLDFAPNSKYNSLDLSDLSPSADLTITIVIIAIVATAAVTAVVIIILKAKLKKKNISYKNKPTRRK